MSQDTQVTSAVMVFPANIVPDFASDVILAALRAELEVVALELDKFSRELLANTLLDEMMELDLANKLLELLAEDRCIALL